MTHGGDRPRRRPEPQKNAVIVADRPALVVTGTNPVSSAESPAGRRGNPVRGSPRAADPWLADDRSCAADRGSGSSCTLRETLPTRSVPVPSPKLRALRVGPVLGCTGGTVSRSTPKGGGYRECSAAGDRPSTGHAVLARALHGWQEIAVMLDEGVRRGSRGHRPVMISAPVDVFSLGAHDPYLDRTEIAAK